MIPGYRTPLCSAKVFYEWLFVYLSTFWCFLFQLCTTSSATIHNSIIFCLVMFDCINVWPEIGNGELGLEHFLYYFGLRRESRDNRPARSSKKKASKSKDNKGKGKATEYEPANPDYYNKWQIYHIEGTSCLIHGPNKVLFLITFENGGQYYSDGYHLTQRTMNMSSKLICHICNLFTMCFILISFSLYQSLLPPTHTA